MHAWVAETSGSSTTCVDHVVTFRTADGGRTWQKAAPIPVRFADPTDYIWAAPDSGANWFSFVDAQNGWLLVGTGPELATNAGEWPGFGARWRVGDLYRTTDGGLHWFHVSTNPGSKAGCQGGGISFSSTTTGWIVSDCGLLVTRDGGATWAARALPITPSSPPVFFDDRNGVLLGLQGLLATSDGGATWTARSLPGATFVDLINPNDGWAVGFLGNDENQAEFGLYHTSDGARTWEPITTTTSLPPLPPENFWNARGEDAGAWGLDFVDSTNGFWTICGGPPGPCMGSGFFKTSDAGRTWTQVKETVAG